jgi:hypothetical protein
VLFARNVENIRLPASLPKAKQMVERVHEDLTLADCRRGKAWLAQVIAGIADSEQEVAFTVTVRVGRTGVQSGNKGE